MTTVSTARKTASVYTVAKNSSGKDYWTLCGEAYAEDDGTIGVKLFALPISGTLQIRILPKDTKR